MRSTTANLTCWLPCALSAQETPSANHNGNLKTLVVATEAKSDSAIAIPPIASVTINLKNDKHSSRADAVDLTTWLPKVAALNGLQSGDLQPWHIVVTYDQFDEDGDNVHSVVYEEYWAGAKKYKRIYKSDNFNQTDYVTEKGVVSPRRPAMARPGTTTGSERDS